MTRCGDRLPAAEADPGTGEAVSFEIPDPVRIGNVLEVPDERKGHTGRAVKGQIGRFPDAKAACNQGGKQAGEPVPHRGEWPIRLEVSLHEGMEQDRRLRGTFTQ